MALCRLDQFSNLSDEAIAPISVTNRATHSSLGYPDYESSKRLRKRR